MSQRISMNYHSFTKVYIENHNHGDPMNEKKIEKEKHKRLFNTIYLIYNNGKPLVR